MYAQFASLQAVDEFISDMEILDVFIHRERLAAWDAIGLVREEPIETHETVFTEQREIKIPVDLNQYLREIEVDLISQALEITAGSIRDAAELLHINRSTLTWRLYQLGIKQRKHHAGFAPTTKGVI